ncbi:orexigenic neuropeptide QRFP [Eudromia elegans]
MRAPYSLSCLFLLSLGACLPAGEQHEPGRGPEAAWRRAELGALLGAARELQLRPRRARPEWPGPLPAGGEKRSGALGHLAEELSGLDRKKGGFTFRFGR